MDFAAAREAVVRFSSQSAPRLPLGSYRPRHAFIRTNLPTAHLPLSHNGRRFYSPAAILRQNASDERASTGFPEPAQAENPLTSVNKGISNIVDDAMSASQFRPPRPIPEDPKGNRSSSQGSRWNTPLSRRSQPGGSSVRDIYDAYSAFEARYARPEQRESTSSSTERGSEKRSIESSSENAFSGPNGMTNNPFSFSTTSLSYPKQKERLFPYKLDSSLGRSVTLTRNMEVQQAITMVKSLNRQNNIKSDFERQRFHERPGLKRKRLKSQRWRRRFKEGFEAIVTRVKQLQKQGW